MQIKDVYLPQIHSEDNEEQKQVTGQTNSQRYELTSKPFESAAAEVKIELNKPRKNYSRLSGQSAFKTEGEVNFAV